jgi:hypothetical protein
VKRLVTVLRAFFDRFGAAGAICGCSRGAVTRMYVPSGNDDVSIIMRLRALAVTRLARDMVGPEDRTVAQIAEDAANALAGRPPADPFGSYLLVGGVCFQSPGHRGPHRFGIAQIAAPTDAAMKWGAA